MKTKLILLTCAVLTTWTAQAAVITFDDYTTGVVAQEITTDYYGFSWSEVGVVHKDHTPNSGYPNGVVSGDYAAYNLWAHTAMISGASFDFNGAYLTGAWNDGLNVEVKGYQGGSEIYSSTVVVNTSGPTWFDFDFLGIDSLTFRSYGGSPNPAYISGSGDHFVMDDFTYNGTVVPAPGAVILAGVGTMLVGWLRRRSTV